MIGSLILVSLSLVCFEVTTSDAGADVKNLIGEPDYRKVRLYWNSIEIPSNGFQVRYCELQSWGAQRCRTKSVKEPSRKMNDVDGGDDLKAFETEVDGLRMATTYTFEIKPTGRDDRSGNKDAMNLIVIPTKGFSAKATQCLPEASEIEVSTGPYFGGRIAVEAADGERCALDGNVTSSRDTYTLRINHTECGSLVNETTVSTFVLVQENLPILTHSTRRFLVLCSFQPETLTVRAGLNLPSMGRGQAYVAYDESSGSRRARNMRTGKRLEMPEALVNPHPPPHPMPPPEKNNILPVTLVVLLMIAGVIGLITVSLRWNMRNDTRDLDNVSMESEISISSTATAMENDQTRTIDKDNTLET
ncbi:hypothetical protein MML48_3g00015916 [Holotrichia oblita]|uniref:Uncharacterized protein n=1 Tax=Holotrichia oblita TaxID=644536 RepID=A0ACB9TBG5_HOLOL|nr:hypothetical protein MML48_3g00015916 [Holotrichia oblita]